MTPTKLYNKQHDSYCTWNGTAYKNDGKVPGACFYGLEKAKNNGFEPIEENIMTTREQAMQFWDGFGDSFFEKIQLKQELTDKYFPKRNFGTLTGSEIEEIFHKENKITENIYLNRLKEQYKEHKKAQKIFHGVEQMKYKIRYQAMRLFCLDTQLISFNEIELMESEINSSF